MALPRFEVAVGAIDGANLVFVVSTAYRPGSTAVFLNGQLKRADFDDGWVETDPTTGVITLLEAPIPADVVQVFFIDAGTGVVPGEEVTPIRGRVKFADELLCRLHPTSELQGVTTEMNALNGRMLPLGTILAKVAETEQLRGTVQGIAEVCP